MKYEKEMIELRHWFHQNAELSNREFKTADRIAEELKKPNSEIIINEKTNNGNPESNSASKVIIKNEIDTLAKPTFIALGSVVLRWLILLYHNNVVFGIKKTYKQQNFFIFSCCCCVYL